MGVIFSIPAVNAISDAVKNFVKNTFYIPSFALLQDPVIHYRIHDLAL